MHEPIRDNLEDYLKRPNGRIPQEFQAHLGACEDCASELGLIETQAKMLRSLHCAEEVEPRAGFYARVMERIEDQARASMWSLFLQPSFGRRLAIASATLVLLLGTYFVTTELTEPEVAMAPVTIATDSAPASQPAIAPDEQSGVDEQPSVSRQRQRDAVLVNLASFHE